MLPRMWMPHVNWIMIKNFRVGIPWELKWTCVKSQSMVSCAFVGDSFNIPIRVCQFCIHAYCQFSFVLFFSKLLSPPVLPLPSKSPLNVSSITFLIKMFYLIGKPARCILKTIQSRLLMPGDNTCTMNRATNI